MFNLKQGTKFNVTYFAKKYGEFITRAGLWTEKSVVNIFVRDLSVIHTIRNPEFVE
jgi:hypothetical protein